jgi:hypothetical protein
MLFAAVHDLAPFDVRDANMSGIENVPHDEVDVPNRTARRAQSKMTIFSLS